MICYLKKVRELLKIFVLVQVKHVPRIENSRADTLAKLAMASQEDLDKRVPVEHLMEPSINVNNDEVLLVLTASSYMDPIWDYLLNGILPSDLKEASKLRAMLARFTLLRGTLYKRGFSAPLLKCIGYEDAMSHLGSLSDPNGESKPSPGHETIYWDSLICSLSELNLYLWVYKQFL